jgi:hypothetical protein
VTIERGRSWGTRSPLPTGAVVVHGDAEAREVVESARRAGTAVPVLGLLGGDLWRTLGGCAGDPGRLTSPEAVTVTVDLGTVVLDTTRHWFVAHLVARQSWLHGEALVAMNAQYLGDWDVAPRSHPGDGRLDVVRLDPARFGWRDRIEARRRLRTGTHLPHPGLLAHQSATETVELTEPLPVRLDGQLVGRARTISIAVERDALTVVV